MTYVRMESGRAIHSLSAEQKKQRMTGDDLLFLLLTRRPAIAGFCGSGSGLLCHETFVR